MYQDKKQPNADPHKTPPLGEAGRGSNNPLNIRHSPNNHWRGEIPQPPITHRHPSLGGAGGGAGSAFCSFESLEWGLRAAFCILRTYATKHKCHCINDIIRRWAPPCENNTRSYIGSVCMLTGFGGNQRLTESDWPRLIRAMARMESGVWLSEEVIERAWRLFKSEK